VGDAELGLKNVSSATPYWLANETFIYIEEVMKHFVF